MTRYIFLMISFFSIFICALSQTELPVRSYKSAVGGRLGFAGKHSGPSDIDFAALSYKRYLTSKSAYEANLGWGMRSAGSFNTIHSISLSISYQLHFTLGNSGIRPFIGVGAAAIYATQKQVRYQTEVNQLLPGVFPILGIDYKAKRNFNMAVDCRPMTIFFGEKTQQFGASSDFVPYAGLSFRRTF